MTKFKTNVFKYIIIPAIAILALLCFAPKSNAFFSVPEDTPSFNASDLQYLNFPPDIVSQASSKFGNILAFTFTDNQERFTDYSELYYILSISGQSFSSVSDIGNWLASCYFYEYDEDSLQLYLDLFSSSGGYTEEQFQEEVLAEVNKITGGKSEGFEVFYSQPGQMLEAPSTTEAIIPYAENKNLYVSVSRGSDAKTSLVVDCSLLREFCTINNVSSYSEFVDCLDDNYISQTPEGEYGYGDVGEDTRMWIESLWNAMATSEEYYGDLFMQALNYSEITLEHLEEAKAGAVEEYKSSDDYTSTINLAKTAGVEEYKKSDSYASVLTTKYNNGYSEGLAAGELSYKTSSENKAALEGEYNKGFDTGFVEGQKKVNVGPVIAGVCILAVVSLALVIVTRKKKNKFRR